MSLERPAIEGNSPVGEREGTCWFYFPSTSRPR